MLKKILSMSIFALFFHIFFIHAMQQVSTYQSIQLTHGTCAAKGKHRNNMEDRHFPDIEKCQVARIRYDNDIYLFGVYDGHGADGNGDMVAEFAANEFAGIIRKNIKNELNTTNITRSYRDLDEQFSFHNPHSTAGATVVTALFDNTTLWIANAGDAEAVACFDGKNAYPITECHTPNLPAEQDRILNLNGMIKRYTVTGAKCISKTGQSEMALEMSLAKLARSLQKPYLEHFNSKNGSEIIRIKERIISRISANNRAVIPTRGIGGSCIKPFFLADPATQSYEINQPGFLVLASDGLWDVISYQAVVNFVLYHLACYQATIETVTRETAHIIAQALAHKALGIHDHDNVTVTLIFFNITSSL